MTVPPRRSGSDPDSGANPAELLASKSVLLAVSGSIAAYKAAYLVRELQRAGADVRVLMTRSACEFVAPLTFEALTGHPVEVEPFKADDAIRHVALAREADALLVAPATAHILARLALGLADDVPTTLALACTAPIVAAPAMNVEMWRKPATQANVATLMERGVRFVAPEEGDLACGEVGAGRLAEPGAIVAELTRAIAAPHSAWSGRRVLITAGGTEQPIDPVRVIGNRSSGRTGIALASAARDLGASVELLLARHSEPAPPGVVCRSAAPGEEMREAVLRGMADADVLLMAAAVSDFVPREVAEEKIKRASGELELRFDPTPDILAEAARARRAGQLLVGFALETSRGEERALEKMHAKGIDAIVLNHPALALEGAESEVTIFAAAGQRWSLPRASKAEIARGILARIEELLR